MSRNLENIEPKEQPIWTGDWMKGERPEGYISTTSKIKVLTKAGFSLGLFFEQDFLNKYNNIIDCAKRGENLSSEQLKELLEYNKVMNEKLDELMERFEVKLK